MMKLLSKIQLNKKAFFACLFACSIFTNSQVNAQYVSEVDPVETPVESCTLLCGCTTCGESVQENTTLARETTAAEFQNHRTWLVDVFFTEHIRYAMSLMTNQMTAVMLQQVKMIGGFFDAKHQLETQRLFQQLMAKAHEDYQPSEGMCDIGTVARGLIVSERKTDLVKQALSNRTLSRQLRSGRNVSFLNLSDPSSRILILEITFVVYEIIQQNWNHFVEQVRLVLRATKMLITHVLLILI